MGWRGWGVMIVDKPCSSARQGRIDNNFNKHAFRSKSRCCDLAVTDKRSTGIISGYRESIKDLLWSEGGGD